MKTQDDTRTKSVPRRVLGEYGSMHVLMQSAAAETCTWARTLLSPWRNQGMEKRSKASPRMGQIQYQNPNTKWIQSDRNGSKVQYWGCTWPKGNVVHSSHVALRHAPPCKGLVPRDWPLVLFSSPSNPASHACMTFVFQLESHGCDSSNYWICKSLNLSSCTAFQMPRQQKSSFWKSTSGRCMLEHLPHNKRITASVMMQKLHRHVRYFWSTMFKYKTSHMFRSPVSGSHYCK